MRIGKICWLLVPLIFIFSIFIYVNFGWARLAVHHLVYPSPIKWDDMSICYDRLLFHEISDKGIKFIGWFPDHFGFLGISKTDVSDAEQAMNNISKVNQYIFKSKEEIIVGGYKSFSLIYFDEDDKIIKIIIVPERHKMIVYGGPENDLYLFKKSIDCIKFTE